MKAQIPNGKKNILKITLSNGDEYFIAETPAGDILHLGSKNALVIHPEGCTEIAVHQNNIPGHNQNYEADYLNTLMRSPDGKAIDYLKEFRDYTTK